MANVQAGLTFGGVRENQAASVTLQVLSCKLSQAATRDDKASPMLREAKTIGTLNLVGGKERLQAAGIIFVLETGAPNVYLARRQREGRIG